MKILITGGAGFIGANLIRQLIAETEHEIINFDKLTYAGNLSSLSSVADSPKYSFEKIDLCDADLVSEALHRTCPDAVVHLAAESHVDRSIDGPGAFIQSNIVGTYNLLQASLAYWQELPDDSDSGGKPPSTFSHQSSLTKSGFRLHHISTDEVYGSLAEDEQAFSEVSSYDPHSPYSASKAASDHLVRAWSRTYGLPVVVSNCSNNYGPFQYPEKLIPMVILKCLRLEPIPVYGDGKQIRDWIHVDDHCRALRLVLEQGTIGRTYNIGGDCEMRNIDLVTRLCAIFDQLVPLNSQPSIKSYSDLITHVQDRPGHDERYAIDASRVSEELGWQASTSIYEGLQQTVQWYLDNKDWWELIQK